MTNLLVQVITRTCANKNLQMKPGLHLAHRENLLPFCPGLLTLSLFLSFHVTSKFKEEHTKKKRKKKKKSSSSSSHLFCKFKPKYSSQKESSTHLFSFFFSSSFPRLLLWREKNHLQHFFSLPRCHHRNTVTLSLPSGKASVHKWQKKKIGNLLFFFLTDRHTPPFRKTEVTRENKRKKKRHMPSPSILVRGSKETERRTVQTTAGGGRFSFLGTYTASDSFLTNSRWIIIFRARAQLFSHI